MLTCDAGWDKRYARPRTSALKWNVSIRGPRLAILPSWLKWIADARLDDTYLPLTWCYFTYDMAYLDQVSVTYPPVTTITDALSRDRPAGRCCYCTMVCYDISQLIDRVLYIMLIRLLLYPPLYPISPYTCLSLEPRRTTLVLIP
jgi:hypothetical protein